MLKGFCNRQGISIFDRVVEIETDGVEPSHVGLDRSTLASFRYLEELRLLGQKAELDMVRDLVSECQVEDFQTKQVVAGTTTTFLFDW